MTSRLLILAAGLAIWGGLITARLYELQVLRHPEYRARAERQQFQDVDLLSPRGTIYDARGRELAVSTTAESAFAFLADGDDPAAFLERLAGAPGVDVDRVAADLERGRRWMWVARQLDPPLAADLRGREIPGLQFLEESRRYYPLAASAGPVLGFVGLDGNGLEGLESRYEDELSGVVVSRTVLRDARRETLQSPRHSFREARPGSAIHLTLDASIQYIVERELERAVRAHGAASGSAVILDPRTGAILAMASVPDFDPNRFAVFPKSARRNRVVMDAFEPGSTFKVVTAAAALEANLVDPVDRFDCENGAITVDGKRIRDHKSFGELTFREVIARSSNVGAIKVGLMVGREALHERLRAFGFGSRTGVDLPGESPGIVHPPGRWGRAGTAYVSFGQGISVTSLQLASAFAAVANGGTLYRPYVVAAVEPPDGERRVTRPQILGHPVSPSTARSLERLLEAVVEQGTGRAAAIPGYRVAGKTGTAQVAEAGGYSRSRHVASFVGFVPARSPVLLCAVAVHGPRGLFHGGEVAAPIFAAIVRQTLGYLGVAPELRPPPEAGPALPPRTAAAGESSAPPERAGVVPDLTGLTAREAVARSVRAGLRPVLHGRGFVERQSPPAGTRLTDPGERVEVWLADAAL